MKKFSSIPCSRVSARRALASRREAATALPKIFSIVCLAMLFLAQQAAACPFCYGAKDGKGTQHMAVAIWFLFGAVMAVLGGIGAFSFHIWRHGQMPTEPYQDLTDEDLSKYE